MSGTYQQGKNWSASGGTFSNGHGQTISNPTAYFSAVASNSHGYNSGYANGHGASIAAPAQYYAAVGTCRADARAGGCDTRHARCALGGRLAPRAVVVRPPPARSVRPVRLLKQGQQLQVKVRLQMWARRLASRFQIAIDADCVCQRLHAHPGRPWPCAGGSSVCMC